MHRLVLYAYHTAGTSGARWCSLVLVNEQLAETVKWIWDTRHSSWCCWLLLL